jgi:hypothetical protein
MSLTIAIPNKPFYHLPEGVVPYHKRPSPLTLSAEEDQQLKSLETLYRQIGALTSMRWLNLRAEFFDPEGHYPLTRDYKRISFPGLLSLGCERTDQPGFLHLLAGMTRIERLLGSVSVTSEENKVTVGAREIEWMEQYWPLLEKIYDI